MANASTRQQLHVRRRSDDPSTSTWRLHPRQRGLVVPPMVLFVLALSLPFWPTMAEANVDLSIGYLPTLQGEHRDKQGLSISGAITYALEKVRDEGLLPDNVHLNLRFNDTKSDLLTATKALTEMMCHDTVAVFGPENTCNVEATISSAWNRMMISHKCADHTVSDKKKFPTFIRTYPTETQVTKSIVALLQHYSWNKFSIVAENSPRWQTVADSLEARIAASSTSPPMTLNHRLNFEDINWCCVNRESCCHTSWTFNIIEKTRIDTRSETFNLYDFMTTMQMMRLFNKGEYMVISVDWETYSPERAREYLWKQTMVSDVRNCSELESPSPAAAQSLLMIVTTKPDENFDNFSKQVRKYNSEAPFHFSEPDIFKGFVRHVPMYAAHLYDAVLLYATALGSAINELNVTTPADIIEVAKDGRALFQRIIKRRKYDSVTGASIRIDDNGDSEGNYTVLAVRFSNVSRPLAFSKTSLNSTFHCHYEMVPVGRFDYNNDRKTATPQFNLTSVEGIAWVRGRAPLDEPPCGYRNENCRESDTRQRDSQIAAGVLGFIFVAASTVTLFVYRKWKVEQEIAGLVWKIDAKDLVSHDAFDGKHDKSTSKLSLASVAVDQIYTDVAYYKGTLVRSKDLMFNGKRREPCRQEMKEMRLMRDIRHDNINPFLGACVESNQFRIVTEYCHKGSLTDILADDDITLDDMLTASLVTDLLKGMIHLLTKTGLPCHGNLKSSNCVITSRWVLQITDYGLQELRTSAEKELYNDRGMGDHEYYRKLLWKAPEVMRQSGPTPVSAPAKADVYAFGLILFEIMTREDAFSGYQLAPVDMVERIKAGPVHGQPPFRPDVQMLEETDKECPDYIRSCVEDCWAEQPEQRPDFPVIRDRLRKMREGMKPFIMDQMMDIMVNYSKNLERLVFERTQLLHEAKQKTEDLLHRMLPEPVAQKLTRGFGVEPESYDAVTIYFSDIVGFTKMSAESTPFEVVNFLNDLYTLFDSIIQGYDVYKVETIGDAYMVVSGLPQRNGDDHAGHIASMALDLLGAVKNHRISHRPNDALLLRIGIHTGPVVAGVVGLAMPRYCLFGDTVNTASRMESNGEPLRIHISTACRKALTKIGGYVTEERGYVEMKGKGKVLTHWLTGVTDGAVQRRDDVGPAQAPLFCRPAMAQQPSSATSQHNNSAGNMSDLRRRSPRLLHRAESTLARRMSNGPGPNRVGSIHGRPATVQSSTFYHQAHGRKGRDKADAMLSEGGSSTPASSRSTIYDDSQRQWAQSVRSLRSNRSVGGDSLRRSCLLGSSSAHASRIQVTLAEPAGEGVGGSCENCCDQSASSGHLPQRRCQSLGKFPDEPDGDCHGGQHQQQVPLGDIAARRQQQFLRVPSGFHHQQQRRRKVSKSLDTFPSDLRERDHTIVVSTCHSERSLPPSCAASQEDNAESDTEHARLIDTEDHHVVLTISNGDLAAIHSRSNGHLKSTAGGRGYQAVRHTDDEGIDSNSEASTTGRNATSVDRDSSRERETSSTDKKWHSCDQLSPIDTGTTTANAKAILAPSSVKQWIVNFFGVGETFSKPISPTAADDYAELHRNSDERESVV